MSIISLLENGAPSFPLPLFLRPGSGGRLRRLRRLPLRRSLEAAHPDSHGGPDPDPSAATRTEELAAAAAPSSDDGSGDKGKEQPRLLLLLLLLLLPRCRRDGQNLSSRPPLRLRSGLAAQHAPEAQGSGGATGLGQEPPFRDARRRGRARGEGARGQGEEIIFFRFFFEREREKKKPLARPERHFVFLAFFPPVSPLSLSLSSPRRSLSTPS